MISSFLQLVGGYFDKRFFIIVWFPTFIFSLTWVLLLAITFGFQKTVEVWIALPTVMQTWLMAGGLTIITVFSYICENLLDSVVRLYEGYWPPWGNWLRQAFIDLHRKRWQHQNGLLQLLITQKTNLDVAIEKAKSESNSSLNPPTREQLLINIKQFLEKLNNLVKQKKEQRPRNLILLYNKLVTLQSDIRGQYTLNPMWKEEGQKCENEIREAYIAACTQEKERVGTEYSQSYAILYNYYPQNENHLMPSRLGNILQAAEEYSQRTYNFDAPTIWPRLIPTLPDAYQTRLEKSSIPLMTMLFSATLALVFIFISGILIVFVENHRILYSVAIIVGVLLAIGFYESSIQRALEYGTLIRSAFDLYRHNLIKALDFPMPSSPLEEWKMWSQIMQWWYFHIPPLKNDNGEPLWYFESRKPKSSNPQLNEHLVYLKLGKPPKDSGH